MINTIETALARQAREFAAEQRRFIALIDPLGILASIKTDPVLAAIRKDPFGYRAALDATGWARPTAEELAEMEHIRMSLRGEARIKAREARQAVHIDELRKCATD